MDSSPKGFEGDTYRTLTAVGTTVMVLEAAKGIEERTRKLFEVCWLRDIVNKLDGEGRDRFDPLGFALQSGCPDGSAFQILPK